MYSPTNIWLWHCNETDGNAVIDDLRASVLTLDPIELCIISGVVKIDKRKMLELLENPSAQRLFDTKSNHINVIQEIQGKLVRITVLKDEFKVISTGIMKQNGLKNGITKGRFIPLK